MSFASFNFTGSVGATIQSIDANWTKSTAWTTSGNIVTNGAGVGRGSDANTVSYLYNATPPSANYRVVMDFYGSTTVGSIDSIVLLGRLSGGNGYGLIMSSVSDTVRLVRYDSAIGTALGSAYSLVFANSTSYLGLELRMDGNQISGYYNGTLVCGPVTDSTYTAAGNPGIRHAPSSGGQGTNAGLHFDNFVADEILSSSTRTNRRLLLGVG